MIERHRALPDDEESLVDRSVAFIKELSSRFRDQAGRKWKATSLGLEVASLRRRRRQWIVGLGEATFAMMRKGPIEPDELQEYFDAVRSMEQQIAEKEDLMAEIEEEDTLDRSDAEVAVEVRVSPRRRERPAMRRSPDSSGAVEFNAGGSLEVEEEPPPGVG